MRKLILIAALATVPNVGAVGLQLCTQASLSGYLGTDFACMIDDKVFSNFSYAGIAGGNATPVDASNITVIPRTGLDGNANDPLNPGPGLLFVSDGWVAHAGQFINSSIGFTVTIDDANFPGFRIKDAELILSGSVFGNAIAAVSETVCLAPQNCVDLFTAAPQIFSAKVNFSPTLSVQVLKNILVSVDREVLESLAFGPAQDGVPFASISSVSQLFSQINEVPEPATWLLFGAGLVVLGALRRRLIHS